MITTGSRENVGGERYQPISVLAHTFRDPGMIEIDAARLKQWIARLNPKTIGRPHHHARLGNWRVFGGR